MPCPFGGQRLAADTSFHARLSQTLYHSVSTSPNNWHNSSRLHLQVVPSRVGTPSRLGDTLGHDCNLVMVQTQKSRASLAIVDLRGQCGRPCGPVGPLWSAVVRKTNAAPIQLLVRAGGKVSGRVFKCCQDLAPAGRGSAHFPHATHHQVTEQKNQCPTIDFLTGLYAGDLKKVECSALITLRYISLLCAMPLCYQSQTGVRG